MVQIPKNNYPDSTITLAKDGYEFISKRCHRFQSDIFQTRLMFQKTTPRAGLLKKCSVNGKMIDRSLHVGKRSPRSQDHLK